MKDKNRFSNLLRHLMDVAKLKNCTLAREVQYDESYISKWLTGSLLPTEKTSDKTFQDISRCIVSALDEESLEILFSEYQVDEKQDLEAAIYDNLNAEFAYVMNLKVTTGSEVAQKTMYYPELTLAQFMKKMRHPVLRQVKSLDVMMATDLLALDKHYQLALVELDDGGSPSGALRNYPGVRFTMLLNLDPVDTRNQNNVRFLQNLLTNESNLDFQMYVSNRTQGKLLFAVKDAYAISGMIMDENHCISVTATEEAKYANALYDRMQSLCSKDALAVRRVTMEQMLRSDEYMRFTLSRNQCVVLNHVTEHFIPEGMFPPLLEEYCRRNPGADRNRMLNARRLAARVMESVKFKVLLSEEAMHLFTVNGSVDFFGEKIQLSPQQRLECLEYASQIAEKNAEMEYRILHNHSMELFRTVSAPSVFLSDSFSYLRIPQNGPSYNLSVLHHCKMQAMFKQWFAELWRDESSVEADYHAAVELMRYTMRMLQVQLETRSDIGDETAALL